MRTMFVLYDPATGKFIALDNGSGGYPWQPDNWIQAKFWHNVQDAIQYRKTMRAFEWQVKEVQLLVVRTVS